ncbi:N-acyl-L-amino-acid amidohydrolase [Dictyocaulus viviparus]|uniref:N-acyl-aliphatic-L-amino acid amidohydrolase n=1 Tax=Dictyocaulus viviparus TaxID=29172 RepID=A0A0D8XWK7_DICVI|nr:N-acyl-L-amino-acid amidohydrolase [Dictyocaulus viviparus]
MTIPGTQPHLRSLMLYSHTDVVPTFKDQWKYDPYSAHKDENGDIYARGAQDMKCVGSQYIEALRRHFNRGKKQWLRTIHIVWGPGKISKALKPRSYYCIQTSDLTSDYGIDQWKYDPYSAHKDENGDIYARGAQDMKCVGSQYIEALRRHFSRGKKQWLRTIHIVWGPDEELGGVDGGEKFCKTDEFHRLNIGFVLDEGLARVKITCCGSPGHGLKFIENTAVEKLQHVMNEALAFRERQRQILLADESLTLGDVTSLNLTIIEGGVQINVLPEKYTAYFDIRVPPTVDFDELESTIAKWCREAGDDVSYEFIQKNTNKNITPTTADDPWWNAFEKSLRDLNCQFTKEIFSGATDSRFLRSLGYRSIGFSPMINTPSLLHDHNEYLNENVYLEGVRIYETLIENLANVLE